MRLPQGKWTNALVLASIGVWLLLWVTGLEGRAFVAGGFFPLRWAAGDTMLAGYGPLVPAILTPLSATLLHAGLLHLAFNMFMLLFCGRYVEDVIGGPLMLALYVVGAYTAAVAEYAGALAGYGEMAAPMVGASGALSALVGAYALYYARGEQKPLGPIPGYWVRIGWLLLGWTAINLLVGFVTFGSGMRIAIAAHIGGFLAGLVLARPLLLYRYRTA